jgi:predicted extracellular nuclease
MSTARIATFNVENLFARFKFRANVDPEDAVRDGWDVNETAFETFTEDAKKLTAQAIREIDADVIGCQEVENLETLRRFRSEFLGGSKAYPHLMAIDGNDPRLIDVAVISRHPIVHVRSYMHLRTANGKADLFSRDCLEADVELPGGNVVTLFVNHLKSMLDKSDPANGRRNTGPRRREQAQAVRRIVSDRFGAAPGDHPWVVLGDLNDYMHSDSQGDPSIGDLVEWDELENVLDRLPEDERWTHFFKGAGAANPAGYHQLDYVLPSRSLAARVQKVDVMRKGQPGRAERYTGERFDGIGRNRPKASDHCPLVAEIDLG